MTGVYRQRWDSYYGTRRRRRALSAGATTIEAGTSSWSWSTNSTAIGASNVVSALPTSWTWTDNQATITAAATVEAGTTSWSWATNAAVISENANAISVLSGMWGWVGYAETITGGEASPAAPSGGAGEVGGGYAGGSRRKKRTQSKASSPSRGGIVELVEDSVVEDDDAVELVVQEQQVIDERLQVLLALQEEMAGNADLEGRLARMEMEIHALTQRRLRLSMLAVLLTDVF